MSFNVSLLPQSSSPSFREGMEMQLRYLSELHLSVLGDVPLPLVCITCFCVDDECRCRAPVYWPLDHAIAYLATLLER